MDIINLGNRILKIMHTPGHSSGSICIYEPKTKILFTGDTVYDGGLFFNKNSDKNNFLESLKNLSELDVKIVFPGHNRILMNKDFKSVCSKMIKQIESLKN